MWLIILFLSKENIYHFEMAKVNADRGKLIEDNHNIYITHVHSISYINPPNIYILCQLEHFIFVYHILYVYQ